jgi:hypothetical protein
MTEESETSERPCSRRSFLSFLEEKYPSLPPSSFLWVQGLGLGLGLELGLGLGLEFGVGVRVRVRVRVTLKIEVRVRVMKLG